MIIYFLYLNKQDVENKVYNQILYCKFKLLFLSFMSKCILMKQKNKYSSGLFFSKKSDIVFDTCID